MNIYASPFTLTPQVRINRFAQYLPKTGVYLTNEDHTGYAEYFPHHDLGDAELSVFLKTFPDNNNPYHQKMIYFLKQPFFDRIQPKHQNKLPAFFNHQLWREGDELKAPVIKVKILHEEDYAFLMPMAAGVRVRLDANALFDERSFHRFIARLNTEQKALIDYIEDPLFTLDWSNVILKTAQDFVAGFPSHYQIFKPNRGFYPLCTTPVIFSGNMSSDLANLQAYSELVERADLRRVHGLLSLAIYQENTEVFAGNFITGFQPDFEKIAELKKNLERQNWSYLCSISI